MRVIDDRVVQPATNQPNAATGYYTGTNGSPVAGYQNIESAVHRPTGRAIATGDAFLYCAIRDNFFEIAVGTLDKTTHRLNRPADGSIRANSSGDNLRIDWTQGGIGGVPTIFGFPEAGDFQGMYDALCPQIYGLEISTPSNTTVAATAGGSFIEGQDMFVRKDSALATISPTLGANTWYNIFDYVTGGNLALDYASGGSAGSTNAPVPFAIPAGNARSKNGDSSRRLLGALRTNGSSQFWPTRMRDLGAGHREVVYLDTTVATTPFRVLSSQSASGFTPIDMSPVIPNNGTAVEAFATIDAISGGGSAANPGFSLDGTSYLGYAANPLTTLSDTAMPTWIPINANTVAALYFTSPSPVLLSMWVWGYRYRI